jgi:hypothetical protein
MEELLFSILSHVDKQLRSATATWCPTRETHSCKERMWESLGRGDVPVVVWQQLQLAGFSKICHQGQANQTTQQNPLRSPTNIEEINTLIPVSLNMRFFQETYHLEGRITLVPTSL